MYCQNCGKANLEEARYCYNCGSRLDQPIPEPAPAPTPVQPANPAPAPVAPAPDYQVPAPPWNSYPQPALPYYPQSYNPAWSYNPGTANPSFLVLHPLAAGAQGLSPLVYQQPQEYYSYVNREGLLVFARKANYGKRLVAGILDWIIASIPGWLVAYFYFTGSTQLVSRMLLNTDVWWVSLVSSLFFFGYYCYFTATLGQTPAKRMVGIRVIRLDGQKPDLWTTVLRQCMGYMVSAFGLFLGFFWAAWDSRRQAWHDKLARTFVVEQAELVEGRDFTLPPLNPDNSANPTPPTYPYPTT